MIRRYRHAQLLCMLVALVLVDPFLEGTFALEIVDVLLALTLISAVVACAQRRSRLIFGVGMALLVLGLSWYRNASGVETITIFYSGVALVFFGYVTAVVLTDVFRDSTSVSADTICGALAGYLLIGVGWAFAYALLQTAIPGSIVGLRAETFGGGYQQYLGYSFVTLTTLGYGNVLPANAQAEALAALEAIVGQVYLTVLVARLVALNLTESRRPAIEEGEDSLRPTAGTPGSGL